MVFPKVDFPQPDSPTTPIISPFLTVNETPSIAFRLPTLRFHAFVIGNHLESFSIARIDSYPSIFLRDIVLTRPINHKFLGNNSESCGQNLASEPGGALPHNFYLQPHIWGGNGNHLED